MKRPIIVSAIFAVCAVSFSQTAYDKCIEECMRAGGNLPTCSNESCDPSDTVPVVAVGQGNPLYLFSYELQGPAPVIDGCLMSRDGDPSTSEAMDEWKAASSRTLMFNDSTVVQLFLVNSPDTLYIGMTYIDINDGNGCGVRLLFDQGINVPPSTYHGSTDGRLSAPGGICNEQGCGLYKAGSSFLMNDLCWNGSSWISDGDGKVDFRGASYFFNTSTKVHHYEFAVPLQNGRMNDSANSDLNVKAGDVIGFYPEVVKMGAGAGTFHWIETNGNAARLDTFPFWAKIQLSVKREYFTLYTGRGSNPPPTIDGSIHDAEWNGAYQRELVLSNFHYGTYRNKIWCLEDSAQNSIYIGVRVFDKVHNPHDYCKIYQEEDGTNATNPLRNYILDNNAENALSVTNSGQFSDLYWNMGNSAWSADPVAADSQTAAAGENTTYTDYEFKVLRSAGAYNIDIPKGGLMGFLIRYHDADKTAQDHSDYFWEYTTNNDAQLLDQQSHPNVYIATGWTNLQLGGPFIQVVKPAASDSIHGLMPVEVSSGTDSLTSVICFFSSDTLNKVILVYQGNGTWTGSINATGLPAGQDAMLVIRVVSVSGVTYERIVNKVNDISVLPLSPGKLRNGFVAQVNFQSKHGSYILVNLEKSGSFGLKIYALNGKKLWSTSINNAVAGQYRISLTPNAACLKKGTYLLMLNQGNKKITQKVTLVK